ncbi:tRNA1(Val) (adenine(37)-N6)-methyltransferase [Clostridium sp. HV4-5-A1G]|uniref:tRNA1(Val) (adenine(37)-N6)-methyltransferase n=1 Tax=Clostridium sp. HV4-5-A1G TaxID=2004595 RepID=UPI00123BBC4F|nr:tRNA1(Val) (adenine(37)-N6)-methyltransferase [Clostridium sp. HV4-5-A1G]KAA8666773.1 tRNA1(Val) (adenine(37)-N6)-methyltransferase [Clostridium sp. HV4-5-A1G]CAB1254387.1 tRNA1(Val) (adenine(37)-N6)-methyltransferase [Clostridiaceae bacterium BL-3]
MNSTFLKEDETLDDLQLKGLYVIQKKSTFRFGIDAVLLANFADIKRNASVIDLCSGTGIIPFILVGKTPAGKIIGIEIQKDMVDMANRSVQLNDVQGKIEFIHRDLKDLKYLKTLPKADVVTVNPPYKLKDSGIVSLKDEDAIARHEICCDLEDVIKAAKIVLKDNGKIYMIHRPDRFADIICTMRKYKIEPKFIRMVHPNINKAPNMVLIKGQNNAGRFLKWDAPLYVHKLDGSYTDEIDKIYGRGKKGYGR